MDYWPFLFVDTTVSGNVGMYTLTCWELLIPQLEDDVQSHVLLQQERAPPHFLRYIHNFLGNNYPRKWIDRGCHISSLPRSPGLTPFDLNYGVR